ncbi:MAG TPA: MqnA/MqnD/SBP family protein [Chloroflexia bacterium]|nr:MqnA/MqnD/SBP family protein [Chloroflexia bacterium]
MNHTPPAPSSAQPLRIGYYNRANFAPLLYPLEAGWVAPSSPWTLEIEHATPVDLLDSLLADNLDAAFVTPASAQQNGKKIAPLGGCGLAVAGAAETALFLSPKRIDFINGGDVAITPAANGSTADHLLRTLVTPYYGIKLNLHPPDSEGYDVSGPRLLFGNDAARKGAEAASAGWAVEDISLAWWIMTGLPMVWELLCYKRDLDARKPGATAALQSLMKQSQRAASEQASTVLDAAAGTLGLPPERVKALFGRQTYTLGTNEQKGLAMFLDMAGRAKVV